jgi:5-methylcytosine-specific restriction endonuclease McrA
MPIDYRDYPPNWKAISLAVREAAQWRCEFCGAQQGQPNPRTGARVVLTVAHLDHDTTHNERANLRALCQACHLRLDRWLHVRNRRYGKMKHQPQLPL